MIIINERWAVDIDEPKYNWMIYEWAEERKTNKRDGTIDIVPAGYYTIGLYYGSLSGALRGIIKQETIDIFTEEGSTLDSLADRLENVGENIYQNTLKYLQSEAGARVSIKK